MGHSAGGHLALWMISRHRVSEASAVYDKRKSHFTRAVSLAGNNDLRSAWRLNLGNGIVSRLMGGSPDEHPDRYDAGSPIELLPNGSRQVLVHGLADGTVPVSQSEEYARRADKLGDKCELSLPEDVGHMDLVDPESDAWPEVVKAIMQCLSPT